MLRVAARVEDAPRLVVVGRGGPARRLEQRHQLLFPYALARHRARRPAVYKNLVNRITRVPLLAPFDHKPPPHTDCCVRCPPLSLVDCRQFGPILQLDGRVCHARTRVTRAESHAPKSARHTRRARDRVSTSLCTRLPHDLLTLLAQTFERVRVRGARAVATD